MKKSLGILFVLVLAAAAWISTPPPAEAALCTPPACLIGPGCCIDRQCGAYCESRGLGAPHCGGNGTGGCCSCDPVLE